MNWWNDAFPLLVTQIWSDTGDYKEYFFFGESAASVLSLKLTTEEASPGEIPPEQEEKESQKMDEALQSKLNQRPQRVMWRAN